ncbi:MAG: hypothetical protein ABSD50_14860 [Smithella sp.]
MTGTDGFSAAATWVTRDTVAALTVATCMTFGANTCVRRGMLEDFSLFIFHYNYDYFFILNHNWSCAYCCSGYRH